MNKQEQLEYAKTAHHVIRNDSTWCGFPKSLGKEFYFSIDNAVLALNSNTESPPCSMCMDDIAMHIEVSVRVNNASGCKDRGKGYDCD